MSTTNENAPAANQGVNLKHNPTRLQTHSSAPVDLILSRLDNIKRSGAGYRADCPAGHTRKQSLSIREGNEGQAKIHCFHGCSGLDILHAIGMELWELYPEHMRDYVPPEKLKTLTPKEKRERRQAAKLVEWSAAREVLQFEARVVWAAGMQIRSGEPLDDTDNERLDQALERITEAGGRLNGLDA